MAGPGGHGEEELLPQRQGQGGVSWQAYFPAEATGATVKVTFAGSTDGPPKTVIIDDANKNHCYELKGAWLSGSEVLRVNC